jgi:hypothetical protein
MSGISLHWHNVTAVEKLLTEKLLHNWGPVARLLYNAGNYCALAGNMDGRTSDTTCLSNPHIAA